MNKNKKRYSAKDVNRMLRKMQAMNKYITELEGRNGDLEAELGGLTRELESRNLHIHNIEALASDLYDFAESCLDYVPDYFAEKHSLHSKELARFSVFEMALDNSNE
jgi:hypothetical protein